MLISWHLEPMVLDSRFSSCVKKSSLRPTGSSSSRMERYWATWLCRRTVSSSMAVLSAKIAASVTMRASSMLRSSSSSFRRVYSRSVYACTRPALFCSIWATSVSIAAKRFSTSVRSFSPSTARMETNAATACWATCSTSAHRVSGSAGAAVWVNTSGKRQMVLTVTSFFRSSFSDIACMAVW